MAAEASTLSTPEETAGAAHFAASTLYVYCLPLPESSGLFMSLSVSQEGKFTSQMMAPGAYRILAFRTPQVGLAYRDLEAMRSFDGKGQVVHLTARQTADVQLQIPSLE